MRIAIYSRKSKFTGKGESIENQIALCREYVNTHVEGAENAQFLLFEDEGYSGKNLDRPQFQNMMEEARREHLDLIVCYRLDRISRSVSDFSSLIETLDRLKTGFICIREQFDTSTPMGKAMMYIASVFAQLERETIAERIRDNMFLLSKSGRWLGGITPFGFCSEREDTSDDGKTRTSYRLSPLEQELELVRLIYSQFAKEKSLSAVSRYLNRNGILTRQGNPFTLLSVREILTNPVYCSADRDSCRYFTSLNCCLCYEEPDCKPERGLMPYNRTSHLHDYQGKNDPSEWIIAIGRHPAVISGKEWVRIQKIIAAQGNHSNLGKRKTLSSPALLSGLLRCGVCGSCMRPHPSGRYTSDGKRVFYYLCEKKERTGRTGCSIKNAPGQLLDDAVCRELFQQTPTGAVLDCLRTLRQSALVPEGRGVCINSLLLEEKRKQIQNLLRLLSSGENGDYSAALIREEMNRLHQQCDALEQELARCSAPACPSGQELWKQFAFETVLSNASTVEKKELLRSLVQQITWDGGAIQIFLTSSPLD